MMSDEAQAYNRHGIALAQEGRLTEAAAYFEEALRLQPNWGQVYNNLANVLMFQGRLDEAIDTYHKSLQIVPDDADTYNNLSNAYRRAGNVTQAEACSRKALWLRPDFADAHNHLGIALELQGHLDDALSCYNAAVRLRPELAEAHNNLGNLLRQQGRFDEAVASCSRAVELKPSLSEAHNNLSAAYLGRNQLDEAAASAERAVQLNPQLAEGFCNLANVRWRQGRLAETTAACREGLRLKPDFPDLDNILGVVAMKEGRLDDALACFEQTLRQRPDFPQARFNRAVAWLLQGNFEKGLPEYEWRWQCKDFVIRPFTTPIWDGGPVAGKTVFLVAEQGLGDTIHFIRYAPLIKQMGAKVIVACQEVLLKLLGRCAGIDQLVAQETIAPPYDVHAPLLSLPGILKTTLQTIPVDIPYVFPDPALVESWKRELSANPGVKVGIAWQGSPRHPEDRVRSIPVKHFAPLSRIDGVHLISLQKGPGTDQLASAGFAVTDLGKRLDDTTGAFMDTAAVMMNLDLVVTSDTAIAHLAGALGVPVWVVLPAAPDWRWMLHRSDSPWYPTMRLFRQTRVGDWDTVFREVTRNLSDFVRADRRAGAKGGPRAITVEVAPGELIDKITILQIKRERIKDADKLHNIGLELDSLARARERSLPASAELDCLTKELRDVNLSLWDVEDDVRECERRQDFGSRFIELARSVYRLNDRRHALKRQIDQLVGARWSEEKSYGSARHEMNI